ncbi:MAG: hypothetical protein KGJ80_08360 [Chloroflexota bacterium]|nr:hypothetical protein [Chloroflexota bacterium]
MKLSVMLIIAAIYWIINGLLGLLAPVSMFGVTTNASTPMFLVMTMKFWGVASLALGVIAWLVRNAEPSKTRDALVLGSIFYFALEAPVSLYGYTIDPASPHVPFAVIEALIAVGLFLAYRSSRATNPS